MATESRLTLLIEAKNRAKRALGQARKQFSSFSDRVRSKFQSVRRAIFSWRGALAAVGAAFAASRIAQKLIELSTRVEETSDKFSAVFGPSVARVNDFLDEFATKVGASTNEAKEFAASAGGILQGLGLTQEEAAAASEEVLRLAGDMASFNNVPIEETVHAVTSALAGEREQLKRLSVVVRQADVDQRALAMTGKESTEALTEQERAMASLQVIQERMGRQVGNLNDTLDSNEGRLRRIRGAMKEVRDTLGSALIPVLDHAIGRFGDANETLEETAERIRGMESEMVGFTETIFDFGAFIVQTVVMIGKTVGDLAVIIASAPIGAFNQVRGRINQLLNWIDDRVADLVSTINQLPWFDIEFQGGEREVQGFLDRAEQQNRTIERAASNIVGHMGDWLSAGREVFQVTSRVREEQEKAADAAERAARAQQGQGGGGRQGVETPPPSGTPFTEPTMHLERVEGPGMDRIPALERELTLWEQVGQEILRVTENQRAMDQVLANMATQTLNDFTDAFAVAAEAAVTGSQSVGEALLSSVVQSIASAAGMLSKFYAAKALAALGLSLVPPPLGSPTGAAAAAKFGAASVAFAALSGALSAGASSIGGGGGGGAAAAGAGAGANVGGLQAAQGRANQPPATIVIEGGLLDMSDPRQSEALREAFENLTGRRVVVRGG